MRTVDLYFDFVSPYSHLALVQAAPFAAEHAVQWNLRPVVYAKVLEAHGLLGPGEIEAKRRHLFHDVLRCAHRLGVEIQGPPAHPFRSLDALRVAWLGRGGQRGLSLAVALSEAAWRDGRDLADPAVLKGVVRGQGLDDVQSLESASSRDVKESLRRSTEEAIGRGVFGVPTFVLDGELFWGHDRLDHLAERLEGRLPDVSERAGAMLGRPPAGRRRNAAEGRDPEAGA